ncbi:unnamed protein product [Protopolystoma xenopodis]|uniref:Uncharacterized protein n=1 Tax=Protopolystoma xenopodis TaxID=117903 RepID=A0A3S5C9G4_9PLAT|nr:unnamed protein product [Protopolystoma xenopodis]
MLVDGEGDEDCPMELREQERRLAYAEEEMEELAMELAASGVDVDSLVPERLALLEPDAV